MNARPQVAGELPQRLADIVGERGIITAAADMAPYLADWRDLYKGSALAVVRPASTAEVAAVVRLCAETRTPVVPQGGNTGMCGAATPDTSGTAVVVALGRMNRIIDVNPLNNTMTVEAGCILANIQQAAADVDRLFPLSLGGEGSCVSGAIFRPMPAASTFCATATRAIWCWASKPCYPTVAYGTVCAACAKTIPATISSISLSAPKARWASSLRRF
jgi:hypothetical protein